MHKLLQQIRDNKELLDLEERGFKRGDEKGKTMNVSVMELVDNLEKQYLDFLKSCQFSSSFSLTYNREGMKKTLADVINNAGCLFLKLVEEESKVKEE